MRASFAGKRRLVAPALLVLAVLAGCGQKNTYVAPPPPKVTVAMPVQRPVIHYLEATGNTSAVNSADLVARVSGFIQAIKYTDGDFVKMGTVLFIIEQPPYALQVAQAQATEDAARASLTKAQAEFKRQAELLKSATTTQAKYDDALASRDSAKASLEQAEASTKLAKINYGYTSVVAPFDGIVTARKVSVGAYVSSSGSPTTLASIVQVDPIEVNFNVSERDVLHIRAEIRKRGLTPADLRKVPVEVGLQTETGYPHRGHLDYASPSVDSSTGTLAARALLANKQHVLLPGMFARVRVPTGKPVKALLVPDVALGTDQGGRYLLIVDKNDVVVQRRVEIGALEGSLRVIEKGVQPGDRVIVSGIQRAIPGQKVAPQTATAATK